MSWSIRQGHVLDVLRGMESESVQTCITSPPYHGLRAYGTEPQVWGGDPECAHRWDEYQERRESGTGGNWTQAENGTGLATGRPQTRFKGDLVAARVAETTVVTAGYCGCGAWRGELGSEPAIALYISHLVQVFDEVKRVLRPDGTLWLNIGDSYAGSGKGPSKSLNKNNSHSHEAALTMGRRPGRGIRSGTGYELQDRGAVDGLKSKDLCLIPERLGLALQDAGWYVRSRIAWCKTSAMPESVKDRPTSAWEHIWLMSKSRSYYYDADAVRGPLAESSVARLQQDIASQEGSWRANGGAKANGPLKAVATRRKPSGWDTEVDGHAHDTVPKGRSNHILLPGMPPAEDPPGRSPEILDAILNDRSRPSTAKDAAREADGSRRRQGVGHEAGWRSKNEQSELRTRSQLNANWDAAEAAGEIAGANQRNHWWVPPDEGSEAWLIGTDAFPGAHFAVFPREIPKRCILAGSRVGDLVLDIFAGSGTTLFVAEEQGRNSIGIELSEPYVRLIEKRMRGARTPLPGLLEGI